MTYTIGMLDTIQKRRASNSESFIVKTNIKYMIDIGYNYSFNALENLYKEITLSEKLDILVISHGDNDHCMALKKAIEKLEPTIIIFSPIHFYKYLLLKNLKGFLPNPKLNKIIKTESKLISTLFKHKDYEFYRVTTHLRDNNNLDLLDLGLERLIETIYLDDYTNPYFDVIVAVKKCNLPKEDKELLIKSEMEFLVDEFETFDTGQTKEIRRELSALIGKLSMLKTKNLSQLVQEVKQLGLIDTKSKKYKKVNRHKEQFIKHFKKDVLSRIDNSMSLIVRIHNSLFTGDAEKDQQKNVITFLNRNRRTIKVIKVPHHGSGSSDTFLIDLYTKLNPTHALISTRYNVNIVKVRGYLKDDRKINTYVTRSEVGSPPKHNLIGQKIVISKKSIRRNFIFK